ncbi:MAG: tol-pal system protein YbgF [Acidobacteriota bacterium]|jgi:TolA-binding protein
MYKISIPLLVAGILTLGCDSSEQLARVEREVGDLKIEVFKLRRQMEDTQEVSRNEQKSDQDYRTQGRRFQADLQSTLSELTEVTKALNARLAVPSRTKSPEMSDDKASEDSIILDGDRKLLILPNASDANASGVSKIDESSFNAAVLDYNRGNYTVASTALKNYLEAYPSSPNKPSALFFLGLCSYNTKAFDSAQIIFEQIIREVPSSSQFLPAKLKRAQCLLRQNLKPAAIKAFRELAEGFAGTQESKIAQQELDDLGVS